MRGKLLSSVLLLALLAGSVFSLFSLFPAGYAETGAPDGADKIADAALVTELSAEVFQNGLITISGAGPVTRAMINVTAPDTKPYQDASHEDSASIVSDNLGNPMISFRMDDPVIPITYETRSTTTTRERRLKSIPKSYSLTEEAKAFLGPSENIESNDSAIIAAAKEISEGAGTDFDRVAKTAIWVNNHVTYEKKLGDVANGAKWTLQNKVGTCDEFTALTIALLRAQGIPARYVSGYAHGDEEWQRHAWAEAYIGEWIPVDSTWLEAGRLDATHIEFAKSATNVIENNVGVIGKDFGEITWLKHDGKISVTSKKTAEKSAGFELKSTSETLSAGESAIIYASLPSEDYYVADLSLEPCSGDFEVLSVSDKDKKLVAHAGEERSVAWIVRATQDPAVVKEGVSYQCPLTFNSRYFTEKKATITVSASDEAKDSAEVSASVSSSIVSPGEEQEVYVRVKVLRAPESGTLKIGVISDDWAAEKEVSVSEGSDLNEKFSFVPKSLGDKKVYAYVSTGSVAEAPFAVREKGEISIESLSAKDFVTGPEKVTLKVRSTKGTPQAVRATFSVAGDESSRQSETKEITGEGTFEFSFEPKVFGPNEISASIESGGKVLDSKKAVAEYYRVPEVSVSLSSYDYGKGEAVLSVRSEGKAKSVSVALGGAEKAVGSLEGEEKITLSMPVGKSPLAVSFTDVAGEKHESAVTIDVGKEGIIAKIIRLIMSFFK